MNAYEKHLSPLMGGKITEILVEESEYGDTYMGLVIQNGRRKYTVVCLSDPEGNGAGFLNVKQSQ